MKIRKNSHFIYFIRDNGFVIATAVLLIAAVAVFGGYKLAYLNEINSSSADETLEAPSMYIASDTGYSEMTVNNVSASVIVKSKYENMSLDECKAKFRVYDDGSDNEKKSYHIKFEEACGFLGMDSGKSWILYSCADENIGEVMAAYDCAEALGMEYTPDVMPVHLYINSVYMGLYLASETVQVSEGRVEINYGYDSDGKVLKAKNCDFLLTCGYGTKSESKEYVFTPSVSGFSIPYVMVSSPQAGVISSEDKEYITSLFDDMLNEIKNSENGSSIAGLSEVCDTESLARMYIAYKLNYTDSEEYIFHMYRKDGEDRLYFGPYVYNNVAVPEGESYASGIFTCLETNTAFMSLVNEIESQTGADETYRDSRISEYETLYANDTAKNDELWN